MQEILADISWLGVIVGAVASFILGWLWYSPLLFGKRWAAGVGVEMGTADEMPKLAMATQLAGLFLMSWFVGVTAKSEALLTVILGTVAFVVLAYSGGVFTHKSSYARAAEAGYWLVSLVVMIICQGIFRGM